MPVAFKLMVVYLVVEALLHTLAVGKSVEITPFGAVVTTVTHGLMVWAIFAHS